MKNTLKLKEEAFYGLAGTIAKAIFPHTEADYTALLSQLLVCYGNAIGRNPYWIAEADKHYPNMYVLLVGLTSKGRKGSSFGHIGKLFSVVDSDWLKDNVRSGLSTGEGLINFLRDTPKDGEPMIRKIFGDKRILSVEPEFASVLKAGSRDGNILSATLRDGWDGKTMVRLVKSDPMRATDPHVSIIGHITTPELVRYLSSTEISNGLGNRFLYFMVGKSKSLPEPNPMPEETMNELVTQLKIVLEHGKSMGEVTFDEAAKNKWYKIYEHLSEGRPGIYGSLTGRGEAQVKRLAMLFALMNNERTMTLGALNAALALWEYSSESVKLIFGHATGDKLTDKILDLLKANSPMTRTALSQALGNNYGTGIQPSLNYLVQSNFITITTDNRSAGRPSEVITLNE